MLNIHTHIAPPPPSLYFLQADDVTICYPGVVMWNDHFPD